MSARIFISYRTADGVDKATALARDLGVVFGDEAVFLDKDDLRGGSAWRNEIHRAFDARPVLLLLVTPQLISAVDSHGLPRIAGADDPVRRELETALEAGARVIPVLCDGLNEPPDASRLPPPFDCIGELTWRRLRAYDWEPDIERLIDDLKAFGVSPVAGASSNVPSPPAPMATPPERPPRRMFLAIGALALTIAVALWIYARGGPTNGVAGNWQAQLWHGEQVRMVLSEKGDTVTLASEPIAIAERPDWSDYRHFWRERGGGELNAIMYRGEGRRIDAPGVQPALDIGLQVLISPDSGGAAIDSGNLSLRLSADGKTLTGRIWLNSAQAEQPAVLTRQR
ncbi:MAG: toll/interleukin-1 receptor domain-containing protein [Dechloromonas sp.]|nr:MAG: toll/interleukin-1 receptor domain-containing protein [Dechloromonas sp.]